MAAPTTTRIPFLRRILVIALLAVVIVPLVILARVVLWATAHTGVYVRAPNAASLDVYVDGHKEPIPVEAGGFHGYSVWRGTHTIDLVAHTGQRWSFPVTSGQPWTSMLSLREILPQDTRALTVPGTCYAQVDVTARAYDGGKAPIVVERRIEGGTFEPIETYRMLGHYQPLWLDEGEHLRWWIEIPCDGADDEAAAIAGAERFLK